MVLCIAIMSPLLSQQSVTWDSYGVGFSLPNDLKVTTNNVTEFIAENDEVYLHVAPWQDENVVHSDLAHAVEEAAKVFEFDEVTSISEANISDFEGYAVQGKKDGVNAMLAVLLDRESSTNISVSMVYSNAHLRTIQKIFSSIYAYDP